MKKTYLLSALVALCALRAWAFYGGISENFGPFRDDEKVVRVVLKDLDMLESSQSETTQTQKMGLKEDAQAPTWLIRNDSKDPKNNSTLFQLVRNKKKKNLKFELTGKVFQNISVADLNGDGLPDYFFTFFNQSQKVAEVEDENQDGITSDRDSFVVLLSSKKTYRAFLVENAHFPEWGVYKMGTSAETVFLHTVDFREAHLSTPSETQNQMIFHLYQLLSVRGSELVVDNGLESRFPKFVAQDLAATHKNHKETKLLTDARKKELLNLYKPKITELHFIK